MKNEGAWDATAARIGAASARDAARAERAPAVKTPARVVVLGISSAFGLGYLPKAPGTFGTLAGIPLWYLLAGRPFWAWGAGVLAVVVVAIAAAEAAERVYGAHDAQRIVIDEVAGLVVTSLGVPFAWPEVVSAFILFRLLDVTKPQPIRWIDRHVSGGFGVTMDDVAAGVLGCALMHAARGLLGGWW